MSYLPDNEGRRKRIRIILILLSVAVIFLYQGPLRPSFIGGLNAKAEPLFKEGESLKESLLTGFFSFFSLKKSLIKENESLKEKLNEAENKLLERDRLLAENLDLKDMLGRSNRGKLVLASVIVKPSRSPYDTLILDVGENDGISAGNKVIAYGSTVIGEVREVSSSASKVVLFSTYGEEYQGIISGKNISVKLTGRGGGNFVAELPRGILIEKGEQVFSVGISPHLLGVVDSIFSDPRNPIQRILFRSPVNTQELHLVEVIL